MQKLAPVPVNFLRVSDQSINVWIQHSNIDVVLSHGSEEASLYSPIALTLKSYGRGKVLYNKN